jgi:hypothetical protein
VKKLGRYHGIGLLGLLLGLVLFGVLVYRTGPATIIESIRLCGPAFALLIPLSALRHVFRTIAWNLCIPVASRRVSFVDLFGMRVAAEALAGLTFAGPLLGESAKAYAVSRRLSTADSLSSIVVENLVYTLSVVLFVASGILLLLIEVTLPDQARVATVLFGVALALPVLAAVIVIRRRSAPLSAVIAALRSRGIAVRFAETREAKIRAFEQQVVGFYGADRGRFVAVLGLELLACMPGIVEAYIILAVTTNQSTLLAAFLTESTFRAVNAVFLFLPLRVGVDEGGAALTLSALGFTAAAGVSLAIIRKIRTLFWIAVGLLLLGRYSFEQPGRGRPAGGEPRLSKPNEVPEQ